MSERKKKVVKLIYDNPGLSGNKLYKEAKSKGFGIKKTDFYQTIRVIRKLPEPTIEKKEKAIPIKYRKPIIKVKDLPYPKKEGSYGIIEVETKDDNNIERNFWIKYQKPDFVKDQLDNIKRKYKTKIIKIIFKGFFAYQEFIDEEFKELLSSVGIIL